MPSTNAHVGRTSRSAAGLPAGLGGQEAARGPGGPPYKSRTELPTWFVIRRESAPLKAPTLVKPTPARLSRIMDIGDTFRTSQCLIHRTRAARHLAERKPGRLRYRRHGNVSLAGPLRKRPRRPHPERDDPPRPDCPNLIAVRTGRHRQ